MMARNDVVVLDGILDQRQEDEIPSSERCEVFELFVLEESLKDYDLSREELASGWIDGRDDGGIDGIYLFVNGHLLADADDFPWPRSGAAIDVWLLTCKHHTAFRQATVDALIPTVNEIFDLSIAVDEIKGSYSEALLAFRDLFEAAYRRLSIGGPKLTFKIIYASRGDTGDLGSSVEARARQLTGTLTSLFSSCDAEFAFVGASELVALHRRAKTFALSLPFVEHLATERNSYVLLVRLEDYWRFVSDETGALRRYLFDSNVRDFLGEQGVNQDIARSLSDESTPEFWWLNNGVTILATGATVPGKTIQLQDIQIVNGLQTTETIHRQFSGGTASEREGAVLVKVIVSDDEQVRDQIIRATNNQTPVEVAALRATDKLQRDIEAILERYEWYYERRRNYYRNVGKPARRFVTPLYLASAMVALVLRNPTAATRLSARFMRTYPGYSSVFSEAIPIEVWPRLAAIFKSVDVGLSGIDHPHRRGSRFNKNWRPLVALLVTARRLGCFDYPVAKLLEIDPSAKVTKAEVEDAWAVVMAVEADWPKNRKPKGSFLLACCEEAAKRYDLGTTGVVGRRSVQSGGSGPVRTHQPPSPEFLDRVDAQLPDQPWKRGVHLEVADKLGCSGREVTDAIQHLIAQRRRFHQRDGVVFDHSGAELSVRPRRSEEFSD